MSPQEFVLPLFFCAHNPRMLRYDLPHNTSYKEAGFVPMRELDVLDDTARIR
jgi:hypothetical protein